MGSDGAVMGMAQGQEGTRAGSEAACDGQQSVPGLVGLLMDVPFWCWWFLLRAVPQGGSPGT